MDQYNWTKIKLFHDNENWEMSCFVQKACFESLRFFYKLKFVSCCSFQRGEKEQKPSFFIFQKKKNKTKKQKQKTDVFKNVSIQWPWRLGPSPGGDKNACWDMIFLFRWQDRLRTIICTEIRRWVLVILNPDQAWKPWIHT